MEWKAIERINEQISNNIFNPRLYINIININIIIVCTLKI